MESAITAVEGGSGRNKDVNGNVRVGKEAKIIGSTVLEINAMRRTFGTFARNNTACLQTVMQSKLGRHRRPTCSHYFQFSHFLQ